MSRKRKKHTFISRPAIGPGRKSRAGQTKRRRRGLVKQGW